MHRESLVDSECDLSIPHPLYLKEDLPDFCPYLLNPTSAQLSIPAKEVLYIYEYTCMHEYVLYELCMYLCYTYVYV
jgi:hypothetical protein